MHLSDPLRGMDSKESTANGSLSSEVSRTNACGCYCEGWPSRGGSLEQLACPRPRSEI